VIFFGVVEGASLLGFRGFGRGNLAGKDGQQDGGRWSGDDGQIGRVSDKLSPGRNRRSFDCGGKSAASAQDDNFLSSSTTYNYLYGDTA